MSVIGDLVSKCCDLSVGAVALAFGDPSGGQLAASALGGLTSIGVGMWTSCEDRTRDRAMKRALANLRKSGAFTEDALKDAATLLGDKQTCLIDTARLSSLATEQNLAKGGAEYLVSQMQPAPDPGTADILRVALQAGIETCLEDQTFLRKLTFEFVRDIARGQGVELEILKAIQTRVDQIAEKVDGMSRAELNELAETWEINDAPTMGLLALKSRLLDTAQDAQRVSRQIANLEGLSARIDNIRAAAADAVDRMALDEARSLIRDARQVHREEKLLEPLKQDALLAEQEAEIELLDHRPEQAYTLLTAAADSFAAVDPLEPARRRLNYEDRLYQHGVRYGGAGLSLCAKINEGALAALDESTTPDLWARAQNNLAVALEQQGKRTAGPEGAALLGQAVDSYRAALRVRTEANEPVRWAMTIQNLAGALQNQGTRTAGPEGAALLAEAVDSCRAALRVTAEADHPVKWAQMMQNLGIALKEQGTRTAGPEGSALLAESVDSYRAALRVLTEAEHRADWAMTRENMALLEAARADHDTCTDPRSALQAALAHVDAALTVFDPDHMPYHFEKATTLRNRLRAQLEQCADEKK